MPSMEESWKQQKAMYAAIQKNFENSLRDMSARIKQNYAEGAQAISKLKEAASAPARLKLVIDAQKTIEKVQQQFSSLAKQSDDLRKKTGSIKISPSVEVSKDGALKQAEGIRKKIQKQLIATTLAIRLMMPEEGIRKALAEKAKTIRRQIQRQFIVASFKTKLIMAEGGFQVFLAKKAEAMRKYISKQPLVVAIATKLRMPMDKIRASLAKLRNAKVKEDMDDQVDEAGEAVKNKEKAAEKTKPSFLGEIKDAAANKVTLGNARALINATAVPAMEQMQLEDMFKARTGDAQVGSSMFAKFKQEALAAGQDVNQTLRNTLSFMPMTKNANQLSELNRFAQQMAVFDNSGSGLEKAASALQDAMSGDAGSIASNFNMSKADVEAANLGQYANAGDLDGFIQAFDQLLEKQQMGKEAFETMMATPAKQVEMLQNNFNQAMADVGVAAVQGIMPLITLLNEAFQEGKFQGFFDGITMGLAVLAQVAAWAGQLILENMDIVRNILIAVGIVALAAGAYFAFAWIAAAWPIFLIIGAIAAIIMVLDYLGVSTESIIGYIAGAFAALGAQIWNIIAMIWNVLISFAEFLANLFVDPIYSVKKLFYDLMQTFGNYLYNMLLSVEGFAGGFMKYILGAINKVIGGINWFTSKINSVFGSNFGTIDLFETDNINAISDRFKAMMDNWKPPTSDKPVNDFSHLKMDMIDPAAAANKVNLGTLNLLDNVQDKLQQTTTNKLTEDAASAFKQSTAQPEGGDRPGAGGSPGMGDPGNIGNIGSVDKVNQVGGIKDKVDISSEDLQIMRDLAEVQSIQNFVSLTPQVNVTTGPIMKTIDEDEMINKIVAAAEREISEAAKGVYA